jgi:phosphohistidine phosphatase SixA
MKRRLIVLRHAKSAWDTDAATDHERPLNKRGRRDAPKVAAAIAKLGWVPEKVVSSDATRTKETWKRMKKKLDKKKLDVDFTRELYQGGFDELGSVLETMGDKTKTVMVIGHNPGWEEAVSKLVDKEISMTTCNAAMLSCDAKSWKDALKKKWKLEHLLRPKDL